VKHLKAFNEANNMSGVGLCKEEKLSEQDIQEIRSIYLNVMSGLFNYVGS